MARITLVCHCLIGLEIIEESSFINIKNMSFGWYLLTILGSSSVFQSVTVSGFTVALSPNIVLYTRLCLIMINPAV